MFSRLNLTAVLAALAVADLLFDRVLAMFFVILLAMSVSRFQVPNRLFIQVRTSHAFWPG